jgi:O-antigen/teichoic acid export membrane protein
MISRLSVGTIWNLVASIFNQGSFFAINIIIARFLGKTSFGEYAIIQSTLLTVSLIAQFSTGITATRYLAEYRVSDRDRAGRILGLCTVVSATMGALTVVLLFILAPWLSNSILKAPHLSAGLRLGGGFLFFAVMNGYQVGALCGLENFKNLAKAGLFNAILIMSFCGLGAWYWGVNGVLTGLSISAVINWLIHHHFLKVVSREQGIFPKYCGLWKERQVLINFALPAALSGFLSMPALWLANIFLVRSPNGYSEMAMYSASMNIRTLFVLLPRIINNVTCSILNNYRGLGNEIGYRHTFFVNIGINAILGIASGFALYLLGPSILKIFGKSFEDASSILAILLLSGLIEILAISLYQIVQTMGLMWLSLFIIVIPQNICMVVMAYIITPFLGGIGLATALSIGWLVQLIINCMLAWSLGLKFNATTR